MRLGLSVLTVAAVTLISVVTSFLSPAQRSLQANVTLDWSLALAVLYLSNRGVVQYK